MVTASTMNEKKFYLHEKPKNSETAILQLTNKDTSREQRISLIKEMFPDERKREILTGADKDKKGRSVSYFRLLDNDELSAILTKKKITYKDNPDLEKKFNKNLTSILYQARSILENIPENEHREKLIAELDAISANPILDDFVNFMQKRLARFDLFKFHTFAGAGWCNTSGAISLSVGAPMMMPGGKEVAAEMIIPNQEIYIPPPSMGRLREMEKEVLTTELKSEWIVDIYIDPEDLVERFMTDHNKSILSVYKEKQPNKYILPGPMDVLQEWKKREGVADLVPSVKAPELDIANPILKQPLKM